MAVCGKELLGYEAVDVPDSVEEDDEHDEEDEDEVNDEGDEDIVLADLVELEVDEVGVVEFEEFADNKDGEEEEGDFVLIFLFAGEPTVGDNYLFQSDYPENHSLEVDDIGTKVVHFPVDDCEN